jgi:hypothetical protein
MVLDAAQLGNILTIFQILAILAGGVWFSARMENKIQMLTSAHVNFMNRLDKVDIKLDGFNTVMVKLATQEERMAAQDARMQELSMRIDTIRFINQSAEAKTVQRKRG